MKKRWYVHGDLLEDGTYYCQQCDLFVPREHYYDDDMHQDEYDTYLRSLKSWKRFKKDNKEYYRDNDAPNYIT